MGYMKSDNINFILKLINEIDFELDINLPLINQINFIDKRNSYKKNIDKIEKYNFDKDISSLYNNSIQNILNNNLQIEKFINIKFYSKNIISNFISSRIIRSIINNLFIKTEYILNFFDYITNKKNYFKIEIYLSNEKKKNKFY